MAATAVQAMLCAMQGNVRTGQAWAEELSAGVASTEQITKAYIENGNTKLVVVSDAPVWVEVSEAPDGTDKQYLVTPYFPLVLVVNSAHYNAKVAYADVA